jgi:hypothetical protein
MSLDGRFLPVTTIPNPPIISSYIILNEDNAKANLARLGKQKNKTDYYRALHIGFMIVPNA